MKNDCNKSSELFFELQTKHYTFKNIIHSVDLALRDLGLIRGMNEDTIVTVQQATLKVIKHMKKDLDSGVNEELAFNNALMKTLSSFNS